jgi:uncharacterized protein (TIGR00255 family)
MILSMTGYGTGSAQKDDTTVTVEIRTVNHRFLDLHIRLSREYLFLEGEIQQLIRSTLSRGRVDVNSSIQSIGNAACLINTNLVRNYLEAAGSLREQFNLQDSLDLKSLLGLPGVVQNRDTVLNEDGTRVLSELMAKSVKTALEGVIQMRRQEGEALRADMLRNLAGISDRTRQIRDLSPVATSEYLRKLQDRIAQLLPQGGIDQQRLAQEAALLAEKCDISEEITRLESHIDQYRAHLETDKEAGKKLDFLLQEMQREANTILSKSGNLEITRHAIAVKADIEKLREQVQNVE